MQTQREECTGSPSDRGRDLEEATVSNTRPGLWNSVLGKHRLACIRRVFRVALSLGDQEFQQGKSLP